MKTKIRKIKKNRASMQATSLLLKGPYLNIKLPIILKNILEPTRRSNAKQKHSGPQRDFDKTNQSISRLLKLLVKLANIPLLGFLILFFSSALKISVSISHSLQLSSMFFLCSSWSCLTVGRGPPKSSGSSSLSTMDSGPSDEKFRRLRRFEWISGFTKHMTWFIKETVWTTWIFFRRHGWAFCKIAKRIITS